MIETMQIVVSHEKPIYNPDNMSRLVDGVNRVPKTAYFMRLLNDGAITLHQPEERQERQQRQGQRQGQQGQQG